MKFVLGAVAAAMILASPVAAQTPPAPAPVTPAPPVSANCSGFAPAPTLPDGAVVNVNDFNAANTAYTAWGEARLAKLRLCRGEIEALQAQTQVLVEAFNASNSELTAVGASWQAEGAEFLARPENARHRRDPRSRGVRN
jgi:hypothetical protein